MAPCREQCLAPGTFPPVAFLLSGAEAPGAAQRWETVSGTNGTVLMNTIELKCRCTSWGLAPLDDFCSDPIRVDGIHACLRTKLPPGRLPQSCFFWL